MKDTDISLRNSKFLALMAFMLICAMVMLMGITFYRHQQRGVIEATQSNLQVAHDLYTRQISYWRKQHLNLVHMLASDARVRGPAAVLASRQGDNNAPALQQAREQLNSVLSAVRPNYEFHDICIADISGEPLFQLERFAGGHAFSFQSSDISKTDIALSLELNEAVFSSIYSPVAARNGHHIHLHMNLTLPMILEYNGKQTRVLLVMVIDPETFLVPLLHNWPVPSASAEAILVRQHQDKIIRLTPPRFNPQELLKEVLPPGEHIAVGNMIQAGREGFVVCRDYKHAQVLARIASIPDTPWTLITKIDKREVMAPLKHTALYAGGAGACVIAFSGLLTLMWWRQHAYRYRNQILQRKRENDTLLQRLDNLSRFANDIILLCDHSGAIVDANERALEAYGYTINNLNNMNIRDLWDIESSEWSAMFLQLESGEGIKFECFNRSADAEEFPVEISAAWIDAYGERMLQAIIRDISERKEAEERLRHQAFYDDLTGLPNRSLATERLQLAIQRTRRNNTQTALLFIDLDLFKHINDTLGHVVGDQVLVLFARRIENILEDNASVARFGADEFLLQIEHVKTMADIIAVVDKVVENIGEPVTIEGFEICATVSIGISVAPDDSSEANQLIRYADTAMYRAKERGRNCYQFFTPDMHERVEQRLSLEGSLRHAVQRRELSLYYQPQVDMRSGKLIGCEALVRWQHPEQGLILPTDFISLAEEIGLIHEIGAWVVEEACRQISVWQSAGYPELKVAVNVSPRQLQNKHLAQEILQAVERHNLNPHSLEVEITETSLMLDTALAIAQMRDLSNGGISLAIDDFGTGYSSLGHLHRFPINKLKIDRAFVNNIDTCGELGGGTIPRAIISLAHELNLNVIAEGIETEAQRDFLLHAECYAGQGYLYSKPLPSSEFDAFLDSNKNVDKR